jgi:hypothetical protein
VNLSLVPDFEIGWTQVLVPSNKQYTDIIKKHALGDAFSDFRRHRKRVPNLFVYPSDFVYDDDFCIREPMMARHVKPKCIAKGPDRHLGMSLSHTCTIPRIICGEGNELVFP